MKQIIQCALVASLVLASRVAGAESPITIGELRCEYRDNPLGIDILKPRLSWKLSSPKRGEMQTAFHVLVASSAAKLAADEGDLWDSGLVMSDADCQVPYDGKPLVSHQVCFWKVCVSDRTGEKSHWSDAAHWSMGFVDPSQGSGKWKAQWIGYDAAYHRTPAQIADDALFTTQGMPWIRLAQSRAKPGVFKATFRKKFNLPDGKKVERAILALTADNICHVLVNDHSIGSAVRWEKSSRLDATVELGEGENKIVIDAYNTDFMAAQITGKLVVQFTGGGEVVIPTDKSWEATQSPQDEKSWSPCESGGVPWGTPSLADIPRVPAPYLRKTFKLDQPIKRATAYATALGAYELHLNGKKVGRDYLNPGWTEFRKRVLYQTYDVTEQLHQGHNVVGAVLGDGWYASDLAFTGHRKNYGGNPRLLVQIECEMADGSHQTIASDETWKASYGPVEHADLLLGAEVDTRKILKGWDAAGFNDAAWQPVIAEGAGGMHAEGQADVTAVLAAAVQGNRLSIIVTNDAFGGDPAYLVPKTLWVEYLDGKKSRTASVAEKQVLNISASRGEMLTIVKAVYGDLRAASAGKMVVEADTAEPIRAYEELPTLKLTEPKPGCDTFDLGQNMVGWARVKINGAAGQRITVRHGEMLNPSGTIYTTNLRGATATDFYTLSGGDEVLEPPFTFHGFRYVEIRGLTEKPSPEMVTGIVAHTEMRRTGEFECSSALVNKLYHNIIWGHKGNYFSIPTDCPQRDERMGWTGDTQFFCPTAAYNYDVAPFFTRWLVTMCEDSQHPDGSFAHVSPDMGCGSGSTAWGDAALICTYNVYRVYGDKRVIEAHWPAMERYMQFVAAKSKNFVPNVGGFGDWLAKGGEASREVMDTAYYAMHAGHMAEMARAVGRRDDAERYDALYKNVKAAFAGFFNADGSIKNSSQTGFALAFTMDLVPDELRAKAAARYAHEVERFNWHLATGFIGTPRLLPGLHLAGRDDVAYKLLLQETYPSWLFQVKLGATTMWERWDGWTPEHGFQDIGMNSFNHYAFGAVGEYMYGAVGGISSLSPGYKNIRIAPVVGEGLDWAKTSYDSIHGPVACTWKKSDSGLTVDVTVPVNTTAEIVIPAAQGATITEGIVDAGKAEGVKFIRRDGATAVYGVGSGKYLFESRVRGASRNE
jgi:alpha-L-rhamnosidase